MMTTQTITPIPQPYVGKADLNLNDCNRPSKIVNSLTYLLTHKKIPTTVVNRWPENQEIYMKEKRLYLEDKLTVKRSEK